MLTTMKLRHNILNVEYGDYYSDLIALKYSVHMNLLRHLLVKCVPVHKVKTL